MTGRAVVLAAAALLATALPGLAQTALTPELQPLVQALQSGKADTQTVAAAKAYVLGHPADGNGYALVCALIVAQDNRRGVAGKAAEPVCSKAIELAPDSALANAAMADMTYNVVDAAASIPYYSKAIALGMTDYGVFWKRCDAYRLSGNLDAAQLDCKKQMELTPIPFLRAMHTVTCSIPAKTTTMQSRTSRPPCRSNPTMSTRSIGGRWPMRRPESIPKRSPTFRPASSTEIRRRIPISPVG